MTVAAGERIGPFVAGEIRAWMGRRGMRQSDLAAALGRSEAWVSRHVNGKQVIDVEALADIAAVLRCDVRELLPRLDSNQQPSGYDLGLVA